jgi:dolichol-phosphate mannosyltransferase
MHPTRRRLTHSIIRIYRHRFIKFGIVGLSGTVVNQLVLFWGYEYLFNRLDPVTVRLNASLALAIFLATIHNYIWNRLWTWGDRRDLIRKNFFVQMGQYFIACWVAIVLQFLFTTLLALWMQYLLANVISIVLASVINYLFNDWWTFAVKKHPTHATETLPPERVGP